MRARGERRPPVLPVDDLRRPAPRGPGRPPPSPRRFETAVPSPLFSNAFIGTRCRARPPSTRPTSPTSRRAIRDRRRLGPQRAPRARRRLAQAPAVAALGRPGRAADRAARWSAPGSSTNTLLVFTSDNGYLIGEHRVRESKVLPYEPSIRVPLLMRGPGDPARRDALPAGLERRPRPDDPRGQRSARRLGSPTACRCCPSRATAGARSGRAILLEGPPTRADRRGADVHRAAHAPTTSTSSTSPASASSTTCGATPHELQQPRRDSGGRAAAARARRAARAPARLRRRGLPRRLAAGRAARQPARAHVVDHVHARGRLDRARRPPAAPRPPRAPGRPPTRAACAACAPRRRSRCATSGRTRRRRGA